MRSFVLLLAVFSSCASAPKVTRSYAAINGMNLYYEVHGSGPDVVLIHGSFCTIDGCFGKLLPELARNHRVIAMELQAHGHTADIDRAFTVTNLVGDVVALMNHLGVKRADVVGYSMGSSVALELALTHSDRVRRLVMATTAFSPEGVKPRGPVSLADFEGTPMLEAYRRVAPHPEQFPRLVARINQSDAFKAQDPGGISASKRPMLLVFAEDDLVTREHALAFFELLKGQPGSRLEVIPGTTHDTMMSDASLAPLVTDFLR